MKPLNPFRVTMNCAAQHQNQKTALLADRWQNDMRKKQVVDEDLCHALDWILRNAVRHMVEKESIVP